ncbi:MAG: PilZ domain-containing protein [Pseudomonadota bacterium]
MTKAIKIRCKSCGKVLLTKCGEERKIGVCPGCKTKLIIPKISEIEARKTERAVISESALTIRAPEGLVSPAEKPACRVMYTEAPPFEFALRRKDQLPILDLSETGLSFLAKKKDAGPFVLGKTLLIEIDFPILIEPVYPYVQVRWANPTEDNELLQIGVEFLEPAKDMEKIAATMVKYVLSKPDAWEVDSAAGGG